MTRERVSYTDIINVIIRLKKNKAIMEFTPDGFCRLRGEPIYLSMRERQALAHITLEMWENVRI